MFANFSFNANSMPKNNDQVMIAKTESDADKFVENASKIELPVTAFITSSETELFTAC